VPHDKTPASESPVQEGDFAAYATEAWPRLVRTAHLLTGDPREAEYLVRTALTEVYAGRRRIPLADVDFCVRRSLVGIHLGRARRRRLARWVPFREPGPGPRPRTGPGTGTGSGPEEDVGGRAAVRPAPAALPGRQRAVLVLRHWEGLSEAETAELLGCSVGAVRRQARRGLAALRVHPGLALHADLVRHPVPTPHTSSGAHR
jgi:RNA polymerase sigma-70 factor (sigma-E family)